MEKIHETKDLDLKRASKGLWLVKVPKYVSELWTNAPPGGEVGKLKMIQSSNGTTKVMFSTNESLVGDPSKVPLDHEFVVKKVTPDQNLTALSIGMVPGDPLDPNSPLIPGGSAAIEGEVKQRCEFKPTMNEAYMSLSRKRVEESNKPAREVIHMDKAPMNYKPKANHDFNIEYDNRKKEEGKKVRADKEKVMDILFAAFEKHQYYNVKDLVKISNQPITYLKEILREICTYNVKAPYKNTWELKREFRHYKSEASTSK